MLHEMCHSVRTQSEQNIYLMCVLTVLHRGMKRKRVLPIMLSTSDLESLHKCIQV